MVYARIKRFYEAGRYIRLFGNHGHGLADPRYVRQNLSQAPDPLSGRWCPPSGLVEEADAPEARGAGAGSLVVQAPGRLQQRPELALHHGDVHGSSEVAARLGIASPSSPVRNGQPSTRWNATTSWIRSSRVALICGHARRVLPDETPYFNSGALHLQRLHHGPGDRERPHRDGGLAGRGRQQGPPAGGAAGALRRAATAGGELRRTVAGLSEQDEAARHGHPAARCASSARDGQKGRAAGPLAAERRMDLTS